MRVLHLTNGSAVIATMRASAIAGRIVPWDDVLHEGPVPAGLNAAALREVRAEFIAQSNGSYSEVVRSFAARDAALEDLSGVDEIVLWFEHDLYDQLQLVQILDRLPLDRAPLVTAVPDDDYLGLLPADRFAGLFPARREVTSTQRLAARDAWQAFRSVDPRAIVDVLSRVSALPHLAPALLRHLQQFPSVANGLSRTEQQTLDALSGGAMRVADLYVAAHHRREERMFMGDWAFVAHIRSLVQSVRPLVTLAGPMTTPSMTGVADRQSAFAPQNTTNQVSPPFTMAPALDDVVELTADGRRVLEGIADRVALCGIDRWLGGVHLSAGAGPVWRWDAMRNTVRMV